MKNRSLFDVMFPDIVEATEQLGPYRVSKIQDAILEGLTETDYLIIMGDETGLTGKHIPIQITDTIFQREAKS